MLDSLRIMDVIDRGTPNQERVPILVDKETELGNYWLGIGIRQTDNQIYPINDNMMWLGNGFVTQGDWLFVYTGLGSPRTNNVPNQSNHIFSMHWGRDQTLFSSPEIFPYLLSGVIDLTPSHSTPRPPLNQLGTFWT